MMSALTAPGGSSKLESEVKMTTLESGGLPLFLQPLYVNLRDEPTAFREWLVQNREPLEELLLEHGALVFRGFAVRKTSDFSRLFEHYPDTGFGYRGGAAPRNELAPRVFESTRIPAEDVLLLHQEMCYLPHPPTKIAFYCRLPSVSGGETLIGDMRAVTRALPTSLVEAVAEKGVQYKRNLRDQSVSSGNSYLDGMHGSWQSSFETEDPAKALADCADMGLTAAWLDDGSLSTSYVAPTGIRPHPVSGEPVWFNQIAGATFRRESIGDRYAAYEQYYGSTKPLPHETNYGDGSPISESDMRALYSTLFAHTLRFPWSAGDVMLVDNWFTAHGRNSFTGLRDVQVSLLY
jgi:alpha-ketoglutarate-dependent taurine dioxygenase